MSKWKMLKVMTVVGESQYFELMFSLRLIWWKKRTIACWHKVCLRSPLLTASVLTLALWFLEEKKFSWYSFPKVTLTGPRLKLSWFIHCWHIYIHTQTRCWGAVTGRNALSLTWEHCRHAIRLTDSLSSPVSRQDHLATHIQLQAPISTHQSISMLTVKRLRLQLHMQLWHSNVVSQMSACYYNWLMKAILPYLIKSKYLIFRW